MQAIPVIRQGVHGTLYLYAVRYTDRGDEVCPEFVWTCWAYNLEHAEDKFYETEEGWRILSLARVGEGIDQHRAIRHLPRHSL
jgi:hypothetical protein